LAETPVKQRLNLVLIVIVAALIAVVYFGQKKQAPKGQPLTSLKPEAIDKITLHHPNAADIVLEKKEGQWALTAPVQVAADPYELNSLLDVATAETKSTLSPKEVKLADLGLDPPAYSLTLNNVKIDFGGIEPLNYRRYVESDGKIDLIDDPPASALDADYSDLVGKYLLPQGAQIGSIAVPGLKLTRSADGKTWTADPADPKAGSDELQKFADAWTNARALWNAATPADAKPAANPQAALITLKDGSTLSFNIVGRDPQLVLERADLKVQYDLAKSDADKLLQLPEPSPPPAVEQKVPQTKDKNVEAAPPVPAAAAAAK
jgi:hypothetical protein